MMLLKKILDKLLKKLYPPRCIFCGKVMEDSSTVFVCARCFGDVKRVPSERCPVCGKVTNVGSMVCWSCYSGKIPYSAHRSAYFYEDRVRQAVIRMKFHNKPQYADTMGKIMSVYMPRGEDFDVVTYVPMTKRAVKKRGYNQSCLLAESIARTVDLPVCELLFKIRETKKQSTLSFKKRQQNLKGAFKVEEDLHGKRIVLVDDVFTTGATITECASMLKRAGAADVVCLSFAMTKSKSDT